jgi:hypothetical protein
MVRGGRVLDRRAGAFGHLVLVGREGRQDLALLTLRHLECVEAAAELGGDLVELLG